MSAAPEQLRMMARAARDAAHLHEHHTDEEREVVRWLDLAGRWEARALVIEYERLKREVKDLKESGQLRGITPEERADWAYGNAVIENADVTREMAERLSDA